MKGQKRLNFCKDLHKWPFTLSIHGCYPLPASFADEAIMKGFDKRKVWPIWRASAPPSATVS